MGSSLFRMSHYEGSIDFESAKDSGVKSIVTPIQSTKILGIDISHWQENIDFALLKASGVEFCIIKASQGVKADHSFTKHLAGAAAAGMIVGAYHWSDPMISSQKQAIFFIEQIHGTPVQFAMIDVEQYWQDWNEYSAKKVTKFIDPNQISANAEFVLSWCADTFTTGIYTRLSFCREYAPGILKWINRWPTWLAQYPFKKGRINAEWAELFSKYMPTTTGPSLPPGVLDWQFWQYSGDKFCLPGVTDSTGKLSPLDLDFYNGSVEDLKKFIGGGVMTDEETGKLRLRVSVPVLNIREGPGTQYKDIGDLHGNDLVEAMDIAGTDAWVEIEPGKWACVQKANVKYLVKE